MKDLKVTINPISDENYILEDDLELKMSVENCHLVINGVYYDMSVEMERNIALNNVSIEQKKIILEIIGNKLNKIGVNI